MRFRLFEFKVMSFGLCNAPAVFQRLMNKALAPVLDVSTTNYLNDTLSYADSLPRHIETNRTILSQYRKYKLTCRAKKCDFHKKEIEWLGVHASEKGFEMDKWKVEAIRDWKQPKNLMELRSFLGFINFYRRFVKDFSKVARPLHDLEKKDVRFEWSEDCQVAFNELKTIVSTAPVLIHTNPDRPYILETDTSDYAYGAILSQKHDDSKLHPIAFLSKSMSPAEKNYDVFDKEMLAVVRALGHWRQYLDRTPEPITIITDHKNLEDYKNAKITNPRHARWSVIFASYNFVIIHRPGSQSAKPDALLRRSDHRVEGDRDYSDRPIFEERHVLAAEVEGAWA